MTKRIILSTLLASTLICMGGAAMAQTTDMPAAAPAPAPVHHHMHHHMHHHHHAVHHRHHHHHSAMAHHHGHMASSHGSGNDDAVTSQLNREGADRGMAPAPMGQPGMAPAPMPMDNGQMR